ncbi:MAG: ATP-binding cassette domain-containing protein [Acidimicrobiia bacterium]|nr:ATP-binding cassette domain-containing protein [Acidimicrobiia bacterium]
MIWSVEKLRVEIEGRLALCDVDLRLESGTVTAVVGGDGAGKTTLCRVLTGLLRLGQPLLAGHDRLPTSRLRELGRPHGAGKPSIRRRCSSFLQCSFLRAARRNDGGDRPRPGHRPPGDAPFGGHAPEARSGNGPSPQARAGGARRANDRSRPGESH